MKDSIVETRRYGNMNLYITQEMLGVTVAKRSARLLSPDVSVVMFDHLDSFVSEVPYPTIERLMNQFSI